MAETTYYKTFESNRSKNSSHIHKTKFCFSTIDSFPSPPPVASNRNPIQSGMCVCVPVGRVWGGGWLLKELRAKSS